MPVAAALLSKERAAELMTNFREGALSIERDLIEFMDGRGWRSLGYARFDDCWTDWLGDIWLVREAMRVEAVRNRFVYALVDDGLPADDIADAFDGSVGNETIENLMRQKAGGAPPSITLRFKRPSPPSTPPSSEAPRSSGDGDPIRVREHERSQPTQAWIRVPFRNDDERDGILRVAEKIGGDPLEVLADELRRWSRSQENPWPDA